MSKHERAAVRVVEPAPKSPASPAGADPTSAGTGPEKAEERLIEVYRRWFEVVPATTDELRDDVFRLRYQVYCVENPFEDPADNPNGLETDAFDVRSTHSLLIHRPSCEMAGTVRLVLPNPENPDESFAVQQVCREPLLRDPARFPVARMAEVSRFSISKNFRRRRGDTLYGITDGRPLPAEEERRVAPHMTLGLIESLVRMSVENDVSYWCAAMEPKLLRLLSRLGIYFDPIGPLVEFHGLRQPCFIKLDTFLNRVKAERPDVWEVITDDGIHWDAFRAKGLARA